MTEEEEKLKKFLSNKMKRDEEITYIIRLQKTIYEHLLKIGIKNDNIKDEKQFAYLLLQISHCQNILCEKIYGAKL